MDNPGITGQLAGLKEVEALRWGNPSSVLSVPPVSKDAYPMGQCWELQRVLGLPNPVCAHTAAGMGMKCCANTRGALLPCPLCQTLGSRAGVVWGDGAVGNSCPNEHSSRGAGVPNHKDVCDGAGGQQGKGLLRNGAASLGTE